ncbi:hypothetical protein O181_087182 [Austropuccinia psidii MF-1]|uniref:Uncharacterized protein n=1 Tax=Austropuccinia psidii MF-1 TaxID=1389203 RepID=A0A9Q3IP69_9BASI|nr:hypothetical protein [Austropuccinia psidii MF-1]
MNVQPQSLTSSITPSNLFNSSDNFMGLSNPIAKHPSDRWVTSFPSVDNHSKVPYFITLLLDFRGVVDLAYIAAFESLKVWSKRLPAYRRFLPALPQAAFLLPGP